MQVQSELPAESEQELELATYTIERVGGCTTVQISLPGLQRAAEVEEIDVEGGLKLRVSIYCIERGLPVSSKALVCGSSSELGGGVAAEFRAHLRPSASGASNSSR